jgi:hypothetical protein
MEETEGTAVTDPFADMLQRIESVADWLKTEAQSLMEPAALVRKEVCVRRYKSSKAVRLHRKPTYLLRNM